MQVQPIRPEERNGAVARELKDHFVSNMEDGVLISKGGMLSLLF